MSRKPKPGVIRPLDPSNPASWDHPDNERYWLVLARELGRAAARRDYKRLHGGTDDQDDDDETKKV